MKLISLYVENFGGLSRYSLDFEAGLTTLVEPNGFGKTTLAEFIRAMFYGFPRKSKTLDKSLRQKYAPWNGGQYGGNLVFEHDGQRYRVERTFALTPKGDTFNLIELRTNKKSNCFLGELGEALFGLDADSFERSVYLPQLRSDGPLATASIQAKLSGLVEDGTDVGNYDKAIAALKAKRSALIPYRGTGGTVADLASEVARLQLRLDEVTVLEKELDAQRALASQAQQDLEATEVKLAETRKRVDAAVAQEADRLLHQQYVRLQVRHRHASEQLSFFKKKYPKGLPQEETLRRAEMIAQRLSEQGTETPCPTSEQLKTYRALAAEYDRLQAEIRELQLRDRQIFQPQPVSGNLLALWIPGTMSLLAGAALLFLQKLTVAAIAIGTGAVVLITGIVISCLRRKKKIRQQQAWDTQQAALLQRMDVCRNAKAKLRAQLDAFCAQFEVCVEADDYGSAITRLEHRLLRSVQMKEEYNHLYTQLRHFLEGFGFSDGQDASIALKQLREDMTALQGVYAQLGELEAQLEDMEKAYGQILLREFTPVDDPKVLRTEEQRLRKMQEDASARLLRARQKVADLRRETERIPALRQELELNQKKLLEERENVRILDATMDFLQKAKENLATAYLGAIHSRFGHYLTMLDGSTGENYLIDTGLQVQLERQGLSRDLAYFSAGETDLVTLCMRLALVDALFQEQDTFLILDDPFINLDEARIQKAKKLLQKLSEHRQILYLTCHSSRA